MVNVLKELSVCSKMDIESKVTKHFSEERKGRLENIKKNGISIGTPVSAFLCNTGHPNGNEVHTVTNSGLIFIENETTGKLVTVLIARPGQLYRYYHGVNKWVPKYLKDIAYDNELRDYNNL